MKRTLNTDRFPIRLKTSLIATIIMLAILNATFSFISADEHTHQHGIQDPRVKAPKVFLDKSPKIVQYQLDRLDNTRLLMVERRDDDKKYLPVHTTILTRPGMSIQDREQALKSITTLNQSEPIAELLNITRGLDATQKPHQQVAAQLGKLLLRQPIGSLASQKNLLLEAAQSNNELLQSTGMAGLIVSGNATAALELTSSSSEAAHAFLRSVRLLTVKSVRDPLRDSIFEFLDHSDTAVVQSAIEAIGLTQVKAGENFRKLATFVSHDQLRQAAVKSLLTIPVESRDAATASLLANFFVNFAEETVPAERTTNPFLEAMQLTDQLLTLVSQDESKTLRDRLDAVVVRVIMVHTVEEEMRYDTPWFAVAAGREVQVVLQNEDLMPHNLVITAPGALQEVALEGAAMGNTLGQSGLPFVPDSDNVIAATNMVASGRNDRITFSAPTEPGEYPYVCTFPGHWMRMYGVMVVVKDLSEFQRNPVEPKDPIGSNRALVQTWKIEDLSDQIEESLRGRTTAIGQKIFIEATCAQCHTVAGAGKAVGPDLTDVWTRWKGDSSGILQEIIDPSHKIEPKYIVRKIITLDGEVLSGIVLTEDKKSISILPNPESTEPIVVAFEDIDEMVMSSVSIMPKGLLDRFSQDEIFELLAYLKNVTPQE